jgi:DNA-binding protein HU-beta
MLDYATGPKFLFSPALTGAPPFFNLTTFLVGVITPMFPVKILKNGHRKGEMHLNKGDLVGKIAKDAGLTKSQAGAAFNSLIGSVTASLKKGQKVTIVGFGTFSVAKRKARMGRNPQTGVPIKIAAHKIPKFASGSDLKKAVR